MLIDVHAHLDYEGFKSPVEQIIEEAAKAGVVAIINCGLSKESNRATKALSERFPIVKPAYGIYPTTAEELSEKDIEAELKWIKTQKPIAISEIGLDGKYGKDFAKQGKVLRLFLALANKMELPVIVHTRQREKECLDILEEMKVKKVVLHCFTGPEELVKRAIKLKYSFSIPPIIVFNKGFQNLVKMIDLGLILTETDSPYLAPKHGEVNTPANVAVTVAKIAEIKGLTVEETQKIIFLNYQRMFI
jgi:TatD DNase family protein